MTLQETKEQLKSLRQHCSEMARGGDEIWENDVKALEKAIELVDKEAAGAYDR